MNKPSKENSFCTQAMSLIEKSEEHIHTFMQKSIQFLKNNLNFQGCTIFFFSLAIILSFFQIHILILQDTQWGGQFNPYTTFHMYLSDLSFALSLFFYGCYVFFNSKRVFFTLGTHYSKIALSSLLLFALVSYFFSINQNVTFFWLIHITKLSIIYLMVINRFITNRTLVLLILWCLAFQSFIGLLQFISQSSIGLTFLGESVIGKNVLNVAKMQFGDTVIVRPYGTFTHANIFGGLMSLGVVMAGYLSATQKIHKNICKFFIAACGIGVLISFSRSAWLATAISLGIFFALRIYKVRYTMIKKAITWFLGLAVLSSLTGGINMIILRLNIFNGTSLSERVEQIHTSLKIIIQKPLGIGLGNYTNAASGYSTYKLMPWEFQPVHNIFLLIGTELGIIAMATLIIALAYTLFGLFKRLEKLTGKYRCFPVYFAIIMIVHLIILGNLDHYFYTNYSATIFLIAILAITTNYMANLGDSGVSIEE